jgi:hypothetical protein
MLLFRSEGHVDEWLDERTRGEIIPVAKLVELAYAWWGDRLAPDWRPRTREQNQAILDTAWLYSRYEDCRIDPRRRVSRG